MSLTLDQLLNTIEKDAKDKGKKTFAREIQKIRRDYLKLLVPKETPNSTSNVLTLSKKFRLTEPQAKFVLEYCVDMNATQAALRVNNKIPNESARSQGCLHLSKPKIIQAVNYVLSEKRERSEVTADWIMHKLKTIIDRCMQVEPVLDKDGQPVGAHTFDAGNACKALELAGRHIGMWNDKLKIDGQININATMTIEQRIIKMDAERKSAYAEHLESINA